VRVYANCVLARRVSLRPIPQWASLEGCTAVALMAEHDDVRQASRHCARACGALTRVRRACLWRAQRAVPTSTNPMGILKSTREFKAAGADKEHTATVRGGGRDPGVRRPGSGFGRPTARSKFFRTACIKSRVIDTFFPGRNKTGSCKLCFDFPSLRKQTLDFSLTSVQCVRGRFTAETINHEGRRAYF